MKAKRGDLVAVVTTERTAYIGAPSELRERVELGKVTSVTRDGIVKRASVPQWADGTPGEWRSNVAGQWRLVILPAERVDVDAALAAYAARTYPGSDSRMTYPLQSFDECKDFLREYRTDKILAGVR